MTRDSALELFGEKGFESTTVEEIADAADVSTRTFFRYFPSKGHALYADHPLRVRELRELLRSRPTTETVLESVSSALTLLRDEANLHRDTLEAQSLLARNESQVRRGLLAHHVEVQWILHAFVKARVKGGDRYGVLTHTLSDVPFGTFCDELNAWLTSGAPGTFDPPIQEIVDLVSVQVGDRI